MRSYPGRATMAATLTSAGLLAVAACSSGSNPPAPSPSPSSAPATTSAEAAHTPAPGAVETSPGGVTTAVGAPSQSSESEYFQACNAATQWMQQQGGDRKTLVEPYLAAVQKPDAVPGPGTFGGKWAELPKERQAAVIVAAKAAADEMCG